MRWSILNSLRPRHSRQLVLLLVDPQTVLRASALACIDERLITYEVLGVRPGHCKGVGQIVKGKGKASTSSSIFSSGSQSQAKQ